MILDHSFATELTGLRAYVKPVKLNNPHLQIISQTLFALLVKLKQSLG
jgi:hypothetical protein